MPSFFRSTSGNASTTEDDDSTSSEESTDSDLERTKSIEVIQIDFDSDHDHSRTEYEREDEGSPSRTRVSHSHDKDILLHSLLEQLCIAKTLNHFHSLSTGASPHVQYTEDHPDVRDHGQATYRSLAHKLSSTSFIPGGLHGADRREEREAYSLGFQHLWDQEPKPKVRLSPSQVLTRSKSELPHRSPGKEIVFPNPTGTVHVLNSATPSLPPEISLLPSTLQSLISHPSQSQYRRDFEEIRLLGKGGYGKVYHVSKRLDGSEYAVKKISLNGARLQRLHQNGCAKDELDQLLIEARTLARLNHPNIVRYYNSWLEVASLLPQAGPMLRTPPLNRSRLLALPGFGSEMSDYFDTESFTESSVSGLDVANLDPYNGPTVDLYLQMDLLPFSLTHYLKQHCFHLAISLRLLLAILDGVQYLHSQGIVHRDLKPDNIFLSAHDTPFPGCVELSSCHDCKRQNIRPQLQRIRPLLGDFGLVTEVAKPPGASTAVTAVGSPSLGPLTRSLDTDLGKGSRSAPHSSHPSSLTSAKDLIAQQRQQQRVPHKVVGTELYRPTLPADPTTTSSSLSSEKLDVFAIGVIAFELLWKFGTKMERYQVLGALKQGEMPARFTEICGGEKVQRLIAGMLCPNEEQRFTCWRVREAVEDILEG